MPEIDEAKVGEFVGRALGVLVGAGTAQMTHVGDRLGLYRALAEGGPTSAGELAARTQCAERYLAEWLAQQTASGFLTYNEASGRYALPPEHAVVLAMEGSPAALSGAFEALAGWQASTDDLIEAFRTGRGIPWGEHDQRVYDGVDRFFGASYRANLVSQWVPALGLDEVLRQGALVADVGCGRGLTTVLLAEAYPQSRFVAFDNHAPSIEHARNRAAAAGVGDRVRFEMADASGFGGGPYDVIWFFDCFHDLGDPLAAARNARKQLAARGTVALVEPFAHDELIDNLKGNPGAGLHYTASTFLCVPHSLSEPGRTALGAQAGGKRIKEVLKAAGFSETKQVATSPVHAVYASRPWGRSGKASSV